MILEQSGKQWKLFEEGKLVARFYDFDVADSMLLRYDSHDVLMEALNLVVNKGNLSDALLKKVGRILNNVSLK